MENATICAKNESMWGVLILKDLTLASFCHFAHSTISSPVGSGAYAQSTHILCCIGTLINCTKSLSLSHYIASRLYLILVIRGKQEAEQMLHQTLLIVKTTTRRDDCGVTLSDLPRERPSLELVITQLGRDGVTQ